MELFATCARKTSTILADELRAMGIVEVAESAAGVRFSGDLVTAYKVILWSRVASRVLLTVGRFDADNPQSLYEGVRAIDWTQHLDYRKSIAVDFTSTSSAITHTLFGAQRVKDAVVDQFKEEVGDRLMVNITRPDLRINVHLQNDKAVVAIDLSGDSLHKRGYRQDGGVAPLRENLAAALLLRAEWPSIARAGGALIDPMCGSGTFVIEGALMAGNVAPGLLRNYFGFLGWKGHDKSLWAGMIGEAALIAEKGKKRIPPILGTDHHPKAVEYAKANVARAGMAGYVKIEQREMSKARPPMRATQPGLVAVNPPYGERIGESDELAALYQELGAVLRKRFRGYKLAMITGNPDVAKNIGLGKRKASTFFNGPIECKLYRYDVE
ncbi:MAG: hypothetical protein JEZ02_03545 [Desulfatibacillum sp.]|nr:hypothetical protein [Desulfatibacillum sp.]